MRFLVSPTRKMRFSVTSPAQNAPFGHVAVASLVQNAPFREAAVQSAVFREVTVAECGFP